MKRCKTCGINKRNSEFYKEPLNKDKLKSDCKECYNIYYDEKSYIRKYNITKQQKLDMIASQNNCCAICKKPFSSTIGTHVDHCHDTGKVRAILCSHCNRGIGCFKDNTFIIQQAMYYIFHYAQQNTTPSLPARDHREGEEHSKHGTILTPGTREDHYDLDHYQRTISGQDSDYRTQTRGGDSLGHGGG